MADEVLLDAAAVIEAALANDVWPHLALEQPAVPMTEDAGAPEPFVTR